MNLSQTPHRKRLEVNTCPELQNYSITRWKNLKETLPWTVARNIVTTSLCPLWWNGSWNWSFLGVAVDKRSMMLVISQLIYMDFHIAQKTMGGIPQSTFNGMLFSPIRLKYFRNAIAQHFLRQDSKSVNPSVKPKRLGEAKEIPCFIHTNTSTSASRSWRLPFLSRGRKLNDATWNLSPVYQNWSTLTAIFCWRNLFFLQEGGINIVPG